MVEILLPVGIDPVLWMLFEMGDSSSSWAAKESASPSEAVGAAVGAEVGAPVVAEVGAAEVGAPVGAEVGAAGVGAPVGAAVVGAEVGAAVGAPVGASQEDDAAVGAPVLAEEAGELKPLQSGQRQSFSCLPLPLTMDVEYLLPLTLPLNGSMPFIRSCACSPLKKANISLPLPLAIKGPSRPSCGLDIALEKETMA